MRPSNIAAAHVVAAVWSSAAVLAAAASSSQGHGEPMPAFVRVAAAPTPCWVGEPVAVELTVGVDRDWFAAHAVQLFLRELDVPVQVVLPWWGGTGEFERVDDRSPGGAATPAAARSQLSVNDAIVDAIRGDDEVIGGRTFTVLKLVRRFAASVAGERTLAAPRLRYAHATSFRDDVLHGRVAEDRIDASVDGAPLALVALDLPAEGRPAAFTGAVGEFALAARAEPKNVRVGDRVSVEVAITGDGNLRSFRPPHVGWPAAFHDLGVRDRSTDGVRTLTWELRVLSTDVREVPRIGLVHWAPARSGGDRRPGYATAWSDAVPITVTPASDGATSIVEAAPRREPQGNGAAAPQGTPADIMPASSLPTDVAQRSDTVLVAVLLGLPWLLALVGAFSRRFRGDRFVVLGEPTRMAESFLMAADRRDPDMARDFSLYLSSRVKTFVRDDSPDETVRLLTDAGVASVLAERVGKTLRGLAAARYGGISDGAVVAAQELVRELEAAFAAGGRDR